MFVSRHQRGLTLLELVISLSLSFLLINVGIIICITMKKNMQVQKALNTLQENTRIIRQIVIEDIHAVGFAGCLSLSKYVKAYSYPYENFTESNKIIGTDKSFTLRHMQLLTNHLLFSMQNHNHLIVSTKAKLRKGQLAIIGDCQTQDIFLIKTLVKTELQQFIESSYALSKLYTQGAELGVLELDSFSVHKTNRQDVNNKTIMALYHTNINGRENELVEGVDDLSLTYTVRIKDELKSLNANQIMDWSQVVGINMRFDINSLAPYYFKKIIYIYVALSG
jgi:hypothetical protein